MNHRKQEVGGHLKNSKRILDLLLILVSWDLIWFDLEIERHMMFLPLEVSWNSWVSLYSINIYRCSKEQDRTICLWVARYICQDRQTKNNRAGCWLLRYKCVRGAETPEHEPAGKELSPGAGQASPQQPRSSRDLKNFVPHHTPLYFHNYYPTHFQGDNSISYFQISYSALSSWRAWSMT